MDKDPYIYRIRSIAKVVDGDTIDADIEKEERMREDERIKVIQTACGAIDKYSDALKALAETEKVELRAELEAKKKEVIFIC